MHTVRVRERTGKDGVLHVAIPLGQPEQEFDVVLVVERRADSPPARLADDAWPPGCFELAGSIRDPSFQALPGF